MCREFDRRAATYDLHAGLQAAMAARVAARAAAHGERPRAILELGCGTGTLTELLAQRFPRARITAVDLAPGMVSLARARLRAHDNVDLVIGDVEEGCWDGRELDLVVSSAAIQWLAEPAATLRLLADALVPGGRMLHSTFGPGTFAELFATCEGIDAEHGLPRRERGPGLHAGGRWAGWLEEAGLGGVAVSSRLERREYASCRAFLREVKRTGASYSQEPGEPVLLAEAMRRYDARYRTGTGVYASYEIVELEARR